MNSGNRGLGVRNGEKAGGKQLREIAENINYEQDQGGQPVLTGISPVVEGQSFQLKAAGQVSDEWAPFKETTVSRSSIPVTGDLGIVVVWKVDTYYWRNVLGRQCITIGDDKF